jgi:urease accessory protein
MIRWGILAWVVSALPVQAHGNLPGGGGFASGFAHPFVAIEHALALVALGLLCGHLGQRAAFPWLIAGLGVSMVLVDATFAAAQPAIIALALLAGLCLALMLTPPAFAMIAGAYMLGTLVGLETDRPVTTFSPNFAIAGTITAALLICLNSMALATWLGPRWNRIPLRVAGAWIAAAAMLILAFLLRNTLGLR